MNPIQLAAAIHIILQRAAAFDVCIIPETGELGTEEQGPITVQTPAGLQRHDSRGHSKFEAIHIINPASSSIGYL